MRPLREQRQLVHQRLLLLLLLLASLAERSRSYEDDAPAGQAQTCHIFGTFSIAADNAYALYVNGEHQANVNGGRTNVAGCDTATNPGGDSYTGCNWQSVDLHEISVTDSAVTLAVDVLDAGGTGGFVGTAVIDGVTYPTDSSWKCLSGSSHGQAGGWSQVNDNWHGDPPPAGWVDHAADFDDSAWAPATEYGANSAGIEPWGDVNRDMGAVDDGGAGVISADSLWIWSADPDVHNDIYCRRKHLTAV